MKVTVSRELLWQVLDAACSPYCAQDLGKLVPAIKAALEQPAPVQEPVYTTQAQQPEQVAWGVDWGSHGDRSCVSIIKKHQNGTIEVVATEYEPPRNRV